MFGLADRTLDISAGAVYLSNQAKAFCFYPSDGHGYSASAKRDFSGNAASCYVKTGDIITMSLDRVHGTLTLWINKDCKGAVAFGIPTDSKLFWAVSMHDTGDILRVMDWVEPAPVRSFDGMPLAVPGAACASEAHQL